MRSKPGYIVTAGVALCLGVTVGWNARPQPSPVGAEPAPAGRPERPPEYFGVVEQVQVHASPTGKLRASFLVRGCRPPAGMPEPTHPLIDAAGQPDRLWVGAIDAPVEQRGGAVGVGVGALLSVWHRGDVYRTDPGRVYPEYVASDPAAPE